MSPIGITLYLFGTIFFLSAVAFAYYAVKNARLMRGPLGHQLMAMGGGLFITASLIGSVDYFIFPSSGLVYGEFSIWIAGLSAIVGGGALRVKEIQRVNQVSLLRILSTMPNARLYLVGIAALVFVSLPLSVLSSLPPLRPEFTWFDAVNMILWAFAFLIMAVAERRFNLVVRPSSAAITSAERKEERLLREGILALRVYSDFASKLSMTIIPIVGLATLRDVLAKTSHEHNILKACELTDQGALTTEKAEQNLVHIPEQQGVREVVDGLSNYVSRLIDLYSAIASAELAQEGVAKRYRAVKEKYGDVSVFPRILRAVPEGFLEEEKLALLSKEELEAKVRDRTQELEGALTKAREATEALEASKASFHNIVERSADGIIVVDRKKVVCFVNPAVESFFGRKAEEFVGETFPLPISASQVTELDIIRRNGENGVAELRVVETEWEGQRAYLALLRDITERVRADEQIKASLREKEVLLKEIHHRVKNNLQVISSLLNLQSSFIQDQQDLEIFQDSQNRVYSMALIHERLYQSQDLARIDLAEYIRDLAAHLIRSYKDSSERVALKVDAEGGFLNIDIAVPCGLILNELVSNALKHAFPDARTGEIHVELYADHDHQFIFRVSDNGVGLPQDLDFQNTQSLGLQLVNMLVSQLDGTIELNRGLGTEFKIRFSVPE